MLAALNLGAVLLGAVAGGLTASVVGLIVGGGLTLADAAWGSDVGLVVGILSGLAMAGWVAGSKARHSGRFHGAVTGMILAFMVMVIARLGGSPAGTAAVVWLAVIAVLISGFTGWLAFRRKAPAG